MNGTQRPPYRNVIVATDGSPLAATALAGGSILADRTGAELHVFHAAWDETGETSAAEQANSLLAKSLLGGRRIRLTVRDLPAASASPAPLIVDYCAEVGDAVVVLGTHGRGGIGATFLGSTARDLIGLTADPFIAYGPEAKVPVEVQRVVACVDGSEFSEASIAEAVRWALALKVGLWLTQVVPPDLPYYVTVFENTYVHNLAKDLAGIGTKVEWEVLHSDSATDAIIDSFGDDPATMLVMATHGRSGLQRIRLGSVAGDVVKRARGPVSMHRPAG
ncbi:MAG: universal stress protein, partial [Acidimicrobiia bacterium]